MAEIVNTNTFDFGNMSKEELYAFIESKGLIKELAAEAKLLKTLNEEEGKDSVSKVVKKTAESSWELVLNDHQDFAIKKEKGRVWKMFVVMTSQKAAFIKDAKTSTRITEASKDAVYGFFRGMPTMEIPGNWVKAIKSDPESLKALMTVLTSEEILEGYQHNCGPAYQPSAKEIDVNRYCQWLRAWKHHSRYLKMFAGDRKAIRLILAAPALIKDIEDNYGVDNVRDFISSFSLSLIELSQAYNYRYSSFNEVGPIDSDSYICDKYGLGSSPRPDFNMDYKAFRDYVLYDAYRMGYGNKWKNFFDLWRDTLQMQSTVYGRIKKKYPEYLQTEHDMMSFKSALKKLEIDTVGFNDQVEEAKKLEATVGEYVFIAPRSKQDFLDEAEMQQNCLASYISKFAEKECLIMFMRYKATPDVSLVTIEIRENRVTQKYQSRNRICTNDQNAAIAKWFNSILKNNDEEAQ